MSSLNSILMPLQLSKMVANEKSIVNLYFSPMTELYTLYQGICSFF